MALARLRLFSIRNIVLIILSLAVAMPASAGLFGSVGKFLGIGGEVGKGLSFIDGLLPGGGGVADDVIGAPVKSAFGGAIRDWKDANSQSIEKLGATNDETVKKLIAGLGTVQEDLNRGIEDNILLLSDGLDRSIVSLDLSLQGSIDRLDNSLTNQTGRLDTVFQKQTSSLFELGRILITVIVVGGAFYLIAKSLSSDSTQQDLKGIFWRSRYRMGAVLLLASSLTIATWSWPDPSGVPDLRRQVSESYFKSMDLDDFVSANQSAAQLTLLSPESSLVKSYEIKSRTFRDLFYRPTVLLDNSAAFAVLSQLSKADQWHLDEVKKNDPEIASAFALVAFQSFESNAELMRAVILARKADESFESTDKSSKSTDVDATSVGNTSGPSSPGRSQNRWQRLNSSLANAAHDLSVDPEVVKLAMPKIKSADYTRLASEYVPGSLRTDDVNELSDYSPVSRMRDSTIGRIEVAKFYRRLLSFYFDQQTLKIRGGSAADIRERACEAFRYTVAWHNQEFTKRYQSQSFINALLGGPFSALKRLQTSLGPDNPCANLDPVALARYADVSTYWLSILETNATGASEKTGTRRLRKIIEGITVKQTATFDAYEAQVALMQGYGAKVSQGGDVAKAAHSDLIEWGAASTQLGMHTELGGNGALSPAASYIFKMYDGQISAKERESLAVLYLYSPLY